MKTFDFSELLQPVTWNCIKLWRYVSIEGQGHLLTLTQSQLYMKLKTGFSQKPLGQSKPNFICKLSGSRKWKFIHMLLVTWPKWLPRPYMVKTLQKSSSLELVDRFPRNLVFGIGYQVSVYRTNGPLVFRKERDCSIRVAKTKALISFAVTAKLICVFVFAYAKIRFSHVAAQIKVYYLNRLLL